MTKKEYRPEIDGLRAVAVVAVLCYHFGLGLPGGYVGVDVFFVISGYLITGILYRELESKDFSLVRFWERRFRRILPALTVVSIAILILGSIIFLPDDFIDLGYALASQAVFAANIFFWRSAGYFEAPASTKPALHLWSLAVEEQFYIVLPIGLLLLHRLGKTRVAIVLGSLAIGSFLLSVFALPRWPSATFYLLPTRAWELLLGSLLSLFARPTVGWVARFAAWLGMLAILLPCFAYNERTPFPGASALLPCLGTAAVIWGAGTISLPSKILSWGPVRGIGLFSYSLYLWHWPILVFSDYYFMGSLTIAYKLSLLTLTSVLAFLSWKWIEEPCRRRTLLSSSSSIFRFAFATHIATLLIASFIVIGNGFPLRFSEKARVYLATGSEHLAERNTTWKQISEGKLKSIPGSAVDGTIHCLVWGDSHAEAALYGFRELSNSSGKRCVFAAHTATAPLVGYESHWPWSMKLHSSKVGEEIVKYVETNQVDHVILIAQWSRYFDFALADEAEEHDLNGEFSRYLEKTVSMLRRTGATVWVMKECPQFSVSVPHSLAKSYTFGGDSMKWRVSQHDHEARLKGVNRVIDSASSFGARVVDPANVFFDERQLCIAESEGKSLFRDTNHLSNAGALHLTSLFQDAFKTQSASRLPSK